MIRLPHAHHHMATFVNSWSVSWLNILNNITERTSDDQNLDLLMMQFLLHSSPE